MTTFMDCKYSISWLSFYFSDGFLCCADFLVWWSTACLYLLLLPMLFDFTQKVTRLCNAFEGEGHMWHFVKSWHGSYTRVEILILNISLISRYCNFGEHFKNKVFLPKVFMLFQCTGVWGGLNHISLSFGNFLHPPGIRQL